MPDSQQVLNETPLPLLVVPLPSLGSDTILPKSIAVHFKKSLFSLNISNYRGNNGDGSLQMFSQENVLQANNFYSYWKRSYNLLLWKTAMIRYCSAPLLHELTYCRDKLLLVHVTIKANLRPNCQRSKSTWNSIVAIRGGHCYSGGIANALYGPQPHMITETQNLPAHDLG